MVWKAKKTFEDFGDKVKITEEIFDNKSKRFKLFSVCYTDKVIAQESYIYEKEKKIKQGLDIEIIDKREHFCMC